METVKERMQRMKTSSKTGLNDEVNTKSDVVILLKSDTQNKGVKQNPFEKLDKESMTLEDIEKLKDIEMLVTGFIPKNQMTMVYAPSNIGKTASMMGTINHILRAKKEMKCYYFDYDNGATTMKPQLLKIMEVTRNFKYISYDKTERTKLFILLDELVKTNLSSTIFAFDSLQHFVSSDLSSSKSEPEVKALFEVFKRLRTAGATILMLSHTTKEKDIRGKETTFRGLNIIKDNLDNMFYLTRKDNQTYIFKNEKSRAMIDKFVSAKYNHDLVLIKSFNILTENEFEQMSQETKDSFMISEVQAVLKREGKQSQQDLLTHLKECDDVVIGRDKIITLLKTYKDKYWKIEKTGDKKNINTYTLIDTAGYLIDSIQEQLS